MLSSSDTSESGIIFIDSMERRYLVDEGSSTTSDHDNPWATVMGATIFVNLATIVGILFLVLTGRTVISEETVMKLEENNRTISGAVKN